MLDVRRLKLLSELARRGTIAAVARSAGYTPSAVSQSLARLEHETGATLLERHGRGVGLTPAALALVARADRILAEIDAAEAELAAEHGVVEGQLVIGSFPSAVTALVIPATAALRERFPQLTIVVREHEPEDGVPLLRSGDLDLLVSERYDDVAEGPIGGLELHPLLTDPMLLVLPAGEAADPSPLGRYRNSPWVGGLVATQYAAALERACNLAGFTPSVVHRADEAAVIEALVAGGLAIALIPALARTGRPGVQYVRATPAPPPREVFALIRRGASGRPAIGAVLDALAEAAAAVPPSLPER